MCMGRVQPLVLFLFSQVSVPGWQESERCDRERVDIYGERGSLLADARAQILLVTRRSFDFWHFLGKGEMF